jgi:hypothetical protein
MGAPLIDSNLAKYHKWISKKYNLANSNISGGG